MVNHNLDEFDKVLLQFAYVKFGTIVFNTY